MVLFFLETYILKNVILDHHKKSKDISVRFRRFILYLNDNCIIFVLPAKQVNCTRIPETHPLKEINNGGVRTFFIRMLPTMLSAPEVLICSALNDMGYLVIIHFVCLFLIRARYIISHKF